MDLVAHPRTKFGKAVQALRKEGFIPAELYGHGIENIHISVNEKEFKNTFRAAGENTMVSLVIGNKQHPVLIHDVQRDYLDGSLTHVDFYEVRMDEKIKTHVPIEFVGEAPAVKEQGGILNRTMEAIEVEALPGNLPQRFTVHLDSLLELNQSIYVKSLEIPKNVKILVDPETVIVSVAPPLKEEEVVVETPVSVADVKVESEEKKAEREKEKGETETAA